VIYNWQTDLAPIILPFCVYHQDKISPTFSDLSLQRFPVARVLFGNGYFTGS
jgi:hypothetical protein